jgi:hypothetical protein
MKVSLSDTFIVYYLSDFGITTELQILPDEAVLDEADHVPQDNTNHPLVYPNQSSSA